MIIHIRRRRVWDRWLAWIVVRIGREKERKNKWTKMKERKICARPLRMRTKTMFPSSQFRLISLSVFFPFENYIKINLMVWMRLMMCTHSLVVIASQIWTSQNTLKLSWKRCFCSEFWTHRFQYLTQWPMSNGPSHPMNKRNTKLICIFVDHHRNTASKRFTYQFSHYCCLVSFNRENKIRVCRL